MLTNSTYYQFGKGEAKYVFARNTRVGFIGFFGPNPNAGKWRPGQGGPAADQRKLQSGAAAGASLCRRRHLAPRLSHQTAPARAICKRAFPVGGSGVIVNTFELRLPPPTLPYVGNSVSFVLFHDMGNVFQHQGDIFKSIRKFSQPNQQTCRQVLNTNIGTCDFRYYSHAVGIGARYKTPVGPIRVDLSYNLNPPIYPVIPHARLQRQLPQRRAALRGPGQSLRLLLFDRTKLLMTARLTSIRIACALAATLAGGCACAGHAQAALPSRRLPAN